MVSTTESVIFDRPVTTRPEVVRPASVVVRKYGRSSLASTDHVRAVAAELATLCDRGQRIVVVVSAMSDTTDDLVAMARRFAGRPDRRELDRLVGTGEQLSAAVLALALAQQGVPAVSLSGDEAGIGMGEEPGSGLIDHLDPAPLLRRIRDRLVAVVTGFQSRNADDDVPRLDRGGSDAIAVALAAALGRTECAICTDVRGVYTADPRVVPHDRLLSTISVDLMTELAQYGAQVLQPESLELAARHGIRLRVLHSAHPGPGTVIEPDWRPAGKPEVVAIAHRRADSGKSGSVSLVGPALAEEPRTVATLLRTFDELGVGIADMTASSSRITVAVDDDKVEPAVNRLHDAFSLHQPAEAPR